MKQPILLQQFDYSIPASSLALAVINNNHAVAEHLPLMKVTIDFENGLFKLEGDWQFMIKSNRQNEASWIRYHGERVSIKMDICSEAKIDLANPYCDGYIAALEGTIKDGNNLSSSSGLLVIDNVRNVKGLISNHWTISFYLYDLQLDDCEIKFKLPLYTMDINADWN